jgi:hypothetical protein
LTGELDEGSVPDDPAAPVVLLVSLVEELMVGPAPVSVLVSVAGVVVLELDVELEAGAWL